MSTRKSFVRGCAWIATVSLLAVLPLQAAEMVTTFEDLALPPEGYWNGADGSGGFQSGWARFGNDFDDTWGPYWSGFAYSQVNDTNTAGYVNQYAAWTPGTGLGGGGSYAVVNAGGAAVVTFPFPVCVQGFHVNNTTYAALSMLHGDWFAKQFEAGDWFKLEVTGRDGDGNALGTAEFYLADFRAPEAGDHYILGDWTWLDLTALGGTVCSLHFALSSSDVGEYGMNTPSYFAMDDLAYVPHPDWQTVDFEDLAVPGDGYWNGDDWSGGFESEWVHFGNYYDDTWGPYWAGFAYSRVNDTNTAGHLNQYAVWTPGTGLGGTGTYAVVNAGWASVVTFPFPVTVDGFHVNNATYAALSMLHGDMFAKKFVAGDWFKLEVTGHDADGTATGTVGFYLADYRASDPTNHYIVSEWTWLDLRPLGAGVTTLHFALSSSDVGDFGMNTPSYFAMDGLRWMGGFSGGLGGVNLFDAPVPGFVGPHGDGDSEDPESIVNPAFAGWAQDVIAYLPALGVSPQWTNAANALGPVTGNNGSIVALGEATTGNSPGSITLRMGLPIADKDGPDFVVYENGFGSSTGGVYAELAYVEVSSDGTNFIRFPSVSLTAAPVPLSAGVIDPRHVFNLAGKHVNAYGKSWGTPFDLAALACHPDVQAGLVNLTHISYVRIVDIPGDGSHLDGIGNSIYDVYPTVASNFFGQGLAAGGFDLEAVGVLNSPAAARIRVTATGPGTVWPYGQPQGAVSVPLGGAATFTLTPHAGQHIADVRINGVSIGVTNAYTFTDVQADARIEAVFGSRLTIVSPHGVTTPAAGAHLAYGPITVSLGATTETLGGTQHVATGWTATGSWATNGTGSTTGTFMLTNDVTIAWSWQTNYWLAVQAGAGGQVAAPVGWNAQGEVVTATAIPDPYYGFAGWGGDTAGDTNALDMTVSMTQPRQLQAHFWAEATDHNVPVGWLVAHGLTNVPPEEAVLLDLHGRGPAWQDFYAGTDPNDPDARFAILAAGRSGDSNYVTWAAGTNGSRRPFRVLGYTNLADTGQALEIQGSVQRDTSGTNTLWFTDSHSPIYYRIVIDTE